MFLRNAIFAGVAIAATLAAAEASAATKGTPELPSCAHPIGTVAIEEPERDWWSPLGLSNPESLIKLFAARSNCLAVVSRGAAMAMRQDERSLGDSGELQRGSNLGKGQVVAADYFITPDIVDSNSDSGGGGLGGAVLSGLGRRAGGFGVLAAGLKTKTSKAHTLITLTNARTTLQEYVAEGLAQKTDVGFGGGGFGSTLGAVGGGYSNTDIGKVISVAYLNAFVDLIAHMQGVAPGTAKAQAPIQAYSMKEPGVKMFHGAAAQGEPTETFTGKDIVYPTGVTNGVWWEVDDENGNRGWVLSTKISPRG